MCKICIMLSSYCWFNKYVYIDRIKSLDEVAEWLRRWTANPLGSPRVGSNPILVVSFLNNN